ncbi:MAG: indolepyruvate oxidoreductase subunit beta [Sulfolobales archaeon]
MVKTVNIAIASVGGQGGLTLSRVLAVAAVLDGLSVRTGETLGMAQRYGSVVSYVRIGARVFSPTFSESEGDYLLGLELLETARALRLLKPSGLVIVSDTIRPPVSASLNREVYDKNKLVDYIRSYARTLVVPAQKLATEVGNPRAANMVLLGVFHRHQDLITDTSMRKAISEVVPPKWLESSLRAFELGLSFIEKR